MSQPYHNHDVVTDITHDYLAISSLFIELELELEIRSYYIVTSDQYKRKKSSIT